MANALIELKNKVVTEKRRIKVLNVGTKFLIIFCITTFLAGAFALFGMLGLISGIDNLYANPIFWGIYAVVAVCFEASLFWIGIIMVYLTSVQLGIKIRVWGIICGLIPIVHLVMLGIIISKTSEEVKTERKRIELNEKRKSEAVCKTKYPILLVHGVFFRDLELFNYWGRIPYELETNGATIFYGNHNSAASVKDSALELTKRIKQIIDETGCEKLNVIAHSKGGLDMRTAIALNGMAPYIASLTTINTPHRGCEFADYLLSKIPEKEQKSIAKAYNFGAEKLGDTEPDFLAAVYDLTNENCSKRNEEIKDSEEVYYQSFGSKLNHRTSGRFPLNMSYSFVKHFDGANDGLVGETSFEWGSKYEFVTTKGLRGISHADMIDLNRENFRGFDVREFYIKLVSELREKGF